MIVFRFAIYMYDTNTEHCPLQTCLVGFELDFTSNIMYIGINSFLLLLKKMNKSVKCVTNFLVFFNFVISKLLSCTCPL